MFTLVVGIAGFLIGVVASALGGAWWLPFLGLGAGMLVGVCVGESVDGIKNASEKTIRGMIIAFGVFSLGVLAFVMYAFLSNYETIETLYKGYFAGFSEYGLAYALLRLLFGFPVRVVIDMIVAKEISLLGMGIMASAVYGVILVFWFACSDLTTSVESKKGYYVVTRDVHSGAEIARREASAEGLAFKENAIIALVIFLVSVFIPFLPLGFGIGAMIGAIIDDDWGRPTAISIAVVCAVLFIGFPIIGSMIS